MTDDQGLRERAPGRWEIRAWNPATGRQEYTSFDSGKRTPGAGVRTARAMRAELVADIRAGRYGGQRDTVAELVERYIAHRRKLGASPTTVQGYESMARAIAGGPVGGKRLDHLTAADLDEWYADLIEGGMSRARAHHYHRLLSAALGQGERWGVVRQNVARLAGKLAVPRPAVTVPPPDRVAALIDAAAASRAPDMAGIIVTAALTGLRRGELCGLRWGDVDVEGGAITVRSSVWQIGKRWGVKAPKTHQVRTVYVGPRVLAALEHVRRAQGGLAARAGVELVDDPFVFSPSPDGAVPKMPDVISQRFGKFCEAAAGEGEPWPYRFHDLRHYSASELLAAGAGMVDVSRRLGHARVSTTSDTYAHPSESAAKSLAAMLDDGLA